MSDSESQPIVPMRELIAKCWELFDANDRRRLLGILLLMLVGTVMEILGVGLIVPVVAVLSNPDALQEIPQLRAIHEWFGAPSPSTFLLWGVCGLMGVFVLKNLFLYASYHIQYRFIYRKLAKIAGCLMGSYLRRPYEFHLQTNTAHLIRNISSELLTLVSCIFIPTLLLVSECLVFLGLFILAVVVSPLVTLMATVVMGLALWIFYTSFRPRLTMWGKRVQDHWGGMIQQAQQGLGGIKEVKLFGREDQVAKNFVQHAQVYSHNAGYHVTLNQTSRLVVETLVVVILLGLVMVLTSAAPLTGTILPTLALYAAIAFRLMPSANRLLSAASNIRYGSRALEIIHADLKAVPPDDATCHNDAPHPVFTESIELDNMTFTYKDAKLPALRGVNLRIEHGAMIGFHGESGGGKTTLVDLILGLIEPEEGKVLVDGQPIKENLSAWQRQIGYVPQSIYLTDDTLRRNIAFGIDDQEIDDERVWKVLRLAQLEQFIHEKPDGLDTLCGEQGVRLSGGQRQRIGIARALYHDPAVLVLDEATAALDVETESGFIDVVRSLKGSKTILIVSHRLSALRHCHERFRLCEGRLESVQAEALTT